MYENFRKLFRLFFLGILKKIIDLPDDLKSLTVELPPKGHKADMSCNVAMVLAKFNNKTPLDLANILQKNFLENFNEFEKIDVAKPGFLNINFRVNNTLGIYMLNCDFFNRMIFFYYFNKL